MYKLCLMINYLGMSCFFRFQCIPRWRSSHFPHQRFGELTHLSTTRSITIGYKRNVLILIRPFRHPRLILLHFTQCKTLWVKLSINRSEAVRFHLPRISCHSAARSIYVQKNDSPHRKNGSSPFRPCAVASPPRHIFRQRLRGAFLRHCPQL